MNAPQFDPSDGNWDFGTIIQPDDEVRPFVFGELIDNEPLIQTVLSDSTSR
jgi:hypothetical protein